MSIEARFSIQHGTFRLQVDLNMPSRGITALFGPSGSGKTTLLRAMAGLDRARDGYLKVRETLWQDGLYFLAPHRRELGYVFQEASLFPHLTVRGNLEYGFKRVRADTRSVTLEEMVALFALEPLLERRIHALSGGERQRVAIARAFLSSPQFMLMDEPLAALDMQKKRRILPFFERMHETLEIPILYVSHDINEVARLADYMILLDQGRIEAQGPIYEMLSRIDLSLTRDTDAGVIIEATVTHYDAKYHLTTLEFSGGAFTISRQAWSIGKKMRVHVLARDVSLTLQHQSDTSILNIFKATVETLANEEHGQSLVRLKIADWPLLARVTQKSVESLGLKPGKTVYAQIKSVALLNEPG